MTLRSWNRLIARLTAKAESGDAEAQWVVVVRKNQRAALRWFRLS